MSTTSPSFSAFLGTWVLIPESCQYEQGDPPTAGRYVIAEDDGALTFRIEWTDAEGREQEVEFGGVPDGKPVPFDGGELADSLSVTLVSDRELRSSAFRGGKELMVAQRQLDATKTAMRVVQLVRIPNGPELANVAVYRREVVH
jgi:hypothetical protein